MKARLHNILHVMGHYYAHGLIGLYVMLIILPIWKPIDFPEFNGFEGLLLALIGVVMFNGLLIVSLNTHRASLCERCVKHTPLNPSEKAERWEQNLATYHAVYGGEWRVMFWMSGLILGMEILEKFIGDTLSNIIGLLLVIYVMISYIRHNKVESWCWRCRQGGDDDHQSVSPSNPVISQ